MSEYLNDFTRKKKKKTTQIYRQKQEQYNRKMALTWCEAEF